MGDAIVQFIDAVDAWLRAVYTWDAEVREVVANAIPEELEGETFESDTVDQAAQAVLAAGRPAIAAVIARGADAGDVALVARYAVRGDWEALCNVREIWPRVSAELEVIAAGDGHPADFGDIERQWDAIIGEEEAESKPIPEALKARVEEALLRALGFQFNRHVRESSVALQGALAAENEATVQAAWQALTQALPREGGPASLDEIQERWAAAGRDVAGIDWATAHLRGVATGLQPVGAGQDGAIAGERPQGSAQRPPTPGFCVRLVQAAAMVGRNKRTLAGWQAKDQDFPLPVVEGGGGKPSEWEWATLRPYLERKSGKKLPEYHPSDPNRPDYGDASFWETEGDR